MFPVSLLLSAVAAANVTYPKYKSTGESLLAWYNGLLVFRPYFNEVKIANFTMHSTELDLTKVVDSYINESIGIPNVTDLIASYIDENHISPPNVSGSPSYMDEILDGIEITDFMVGYAMSFASLGILIAFFFLVGFLFYLFYCFCCCCCCRGKENSNPNIISYIFFYLGVCALLVSGISFVMSHSGLTGMTDNIVSVNETIPSMAISIKKSVVDIVDYLDDYVNETTSELKTWFDDVEDHINAQVDSINDLIDAVEYAALDTVGGVFGLFETGGDVETKLTQLENKIKTYDPSFEITDPFSSLDSIKLSIEDGLESIRGLVEFINPIIEMVVDFKGNFSEIASNFTSDSPTISEPLDIVYEALDNLSKPQWYRSYLDDEVSDMANTAVGYYDDYVGYVKYGFIVLSLPIFLSILLRVIAFHTHCCCSSCIASTTCASGFFCNLIFFCVGFAFTFAGFLMTYFGSEFVPTIDHTFDRVTQLSELSGGRIPLINVKEMIGGDIDKYLPIEIVIPSKTLAVPAKAKFLSNIIDANDDKKFNEMFPFLSYIRFNEYLDDLLLNLTKFVGSGYTRPEFLQEMLDNYTNTSFITEFINPDLSSVVDTDPMFADIRDKLNDPLIQGSPDAAEIEQLVQDLEGLVSTTDADSELSKRYKKVTDLVDINLTITIETVVNTTEDFARTKISRVLEIISELPDHIDELLDLIPTKVISGPLRLVYQTAIYHPAYLSTCLSISGHFILVGLLLTAIVLCIRRRGMLPKDSVRKRDLGSEVDYLESRRYDSDDNYTSSSSNSETSYSSSDRGYKKSQRRSGNSHTEKFFI